MSELTNLTAKEIQSGIVSKKFKATEVMQSFLDQINTLDKNLNSFISLNDKAIEQAKKVDDKISAGENIGALGGVPIAIKDMLCTKGLKTTAGSKMLENFIPPYSATVVNKLESSGAIVIGKCNQDEFAMGSSNETSYYGVCKNPWNPEYVPGGSSGGSAVAVAARMAPISIGTDTGGSIRQPASFCGVVGVKPTYGRVSRYGIVAFASSLDQAGPFSRSIEDSTLVLESICGQDAYDSTTSREAVAPWSEKLNEKINKLRVGLPKEYFEGTLDPSVAKSIEIAKDALKEIGCEFVEVSIPHTKYSVPIYYIIATSEASSNLARYDGVRFGYRANFEDKPAADLIDFYCRNRGEGFGSEVKRRITLGTYTLSSGYYDAYYKKACQVRNLLKQDFETSFDKCDIMLSPVTRTPAFKIGERIADPVTMYKNDIFTTSTNLAGLPGLSLPVTLSKDKLPVGIQLTAAAFSEERLLQVAHQMEQIISFKEKPTNV